MVLVCVEIASFFAFLCILLLKNHYDGDNDADKDHRSKTDANNYLIALTVFFIIFPGTAFIITDIGRMSTSARVE